MEMSITGYNMLKYVFFHILTIWKNVLGNEMWLLFATNSPVYTWTIFQV